MSLILPSSAKGDLLSAINRLFELAVFPRIARTQVPQVQEHLRYLQASPDSLRTSVKLETFPAVRRTVISIILDLTDDPSTNG